MSTPSTWMVEPQTLEVTSIRTAGTSGAGALRGVAADRAREAETRDAGADGPGSLAPSEGAGATAAPAAETAPGAG